MDPSDFASTIEKYAAPNRKKREDFKEEKPSTLSRLAVPGAAAAAGLAGAASIPRVAKRMGKKMNPDVLKSMLKPGDIVLTGRKSIRAHLDPSDYKKLHEKVYWGAMKPAAGSYTPHGVLLVGKPGAKSYRDPSWAPYVHQVEQVQKGILSGPLQKIDRFVVLRPKKGVSKQQQSKIFSWAKKQARGQGKEYGMLSAVAHGGGGVIVPKRLRDLCTSRKGKMFCTTFPARAYEQAGAPIVSGKARSALSKDVLMSKKLKPIGWAGAKISRAEKMQVNVLPRVVRGAAWAGAGAAGAYGIKKLVEHFSKQKKKANASKLLKQWDKKATKKV